MTLVIAHRGASAAAPENTVEAFTKAVQMGADGIELDVRRTADDHLVVHHDAHLPDGRLIRSTNRLDLPQAVPTLSAALDACAGAFVNIEIKNHVSEPDHDPSRTVARMVADELIARTDPTSRWLISSFDLESVNAMSRLIPAIRTAFLTICDPTAGLAATAQHGHTAWHPNYRDVDENLIKAAHALGIAVNVWTCDDPDIQRRLMDSGIDGICTNVPNQAVAIRARQG